MEMLLVFIVLIVIVLVMAALLGASAKGKAKDYQYSKKSPFLTSAERKLHKELKTALGEEYEIFANTRLNDVIEPKKGYDSKTRYGANARIRQMHIDFIITDKKYNILAAIELDGESHNRKKQQERDAKKQTFLESAGVPFLRLKNKAPNNVQAVIELLKMNTK